MHAAATLGRSDALAAWAVVFAIEALLVGTYATFRLNPAASWIATGLAASAYGLFAAALLTDPVDLLRVTGPIGAFLLAGWAALVITNRGDRLILWRWPVLVLAQGALVTASIAATVALGGATASGVLAAIAAWEALLFTLVATTTTTKFGGVVYPWVGVVFWVLAYVFFVDWVGWGTGTVTVVTIAVGTVLSGGDGGVPHCCRASSPGLG